MGFCQGDPFRDCASHGSGGTDHSDRLSVALHHHFGALANLINHGMQVARQLRFRDVDFRHIHIIAGPCPKLYLLLMTSISKWASICLLAGALFAQNPGIQRTVVHKSDVSVPGREAVIARVEIAPGAFAGRHTHPGDEISYILEGEGEILREGQPAQKVKAGDGIVIVAGTIHDAHNTGSQPLKLVGVYVVEKGKPLATPAR